jgi:hypothetical protein
VEAPPAPVGEPTAMETVLSELKSIKALQMEILSTLIQASPIHTKAQGASLELL